MKASSSHMFSPFGHSDVNEIFAANVKKVIFLYTLGLKLEDEVCNFHYKHPDNTFF